MLGTKKQGRRLETLNNSTAQQETTAIQSSIGSCLQKRCPHCIVSATLALSNALGHEAACQIFTRVLTGVPAARSHNQEWKLIMSFVWSTTCIWQGSGSDHATSFGREAELPPCQAWAVLAVCLLPFSYFAPGGRFSRAHWETLILLTSQKSAHCNRTGWYGIEWLLRTLRQERMRLPRNISLFVCDQQQSVSKWEKSPYWTPIPN